MKAPDQLVAWSGPGQSMVRRAAAWHAWSPAWLPSRVAAVVRRRSLRRYGAPVLCQLATGDKFVAHPSDLLQCLVATTGAWEVELFAAVQPLVDPGSCVVDIGAHVGYAALMFARWVGREGRVHCFEPMPGLRAQLTANLAINQLEDRVTCVPLAVSDGPGQVPFFESSAANTGMNSLIDTGSAAATRSVETVALDDWLEPTGAGEIALVKIDVEGAEARVVRGMGRGLATGRYRSMLIELHPDVAPQSYAEIVALVDALPVRYTVFEWRDERWSAEPHLRASAYALLVVRGDVASRVAQA